MTKLFLFDIEGTTTDFNFVHKVLFPYARKRIVEFVKKNADALKAPLAEVEKTISEERLNLSPVEALLKWIDEDRKHKALKEIQGLIWDEGYQKGDFQGHVYPDVKPFFERIKKEGKEVAIYSSGSVHAQKMIMKNSTAGDLTPFISSYFDTAVGHKREKASYENIAKCLDLSPGDIKFFSDIPEELTAAQAAGMKATHVVREGTPPSEFPMIADFSEA